MGQSSPLLLTTPGDHAYLDFNEMITKHHLNYSVDTSLLEKVPIEQKGQPLPI
jgi:hypothetical protein